VPIRLYRYISDPVEVNQITCERRVLSRNSATEHLTWYTTERLDTPDMARHSLALPVAPTHRVGPIPCDDVGLLQVPLRNAAPFGGHPGGALECASRSSVWLFGFRDLCGNKWEF
jgi:hypothetical protein